MFPYRFYPSRYFARRYWAPVISAQTAVGSNLGLSWEVREVVGRMLPLRWRVGEPVAPAVAAGGGRAEVPVGATVVGSAFGLYWQLADTVAAELVIRIAVAEVVRSQMVLVFSSEDFFTINREFLYGELEEDEVVVESWLRAASEDQ